MFLSFKGEFREATRADRLNSECFTEHASAPCANDLGDVHWSIIYVVNNVLAGWLIWHFCLL